MGTSLVAKAFDDNADLHDRIRQTYWYNPVFSVLANNNITEKFEKDDRVRYFIDLLDPVSLGELGSAGPRNVVYRSRFSWSDLLAPHKLDQWEKDQGQLPNDPVANTSADQALDDGFLLDFGQDWDAAALNF